VLPALLRELPNKEQRRTFETAITRHTMIHEQMARFFRVSAVMRTRWRLWWLSWAPFPLSIMTSTDINDPRQREIAATA